MANYLYAKECVLSSFSVILAVLYLRKGKAGKNFLRESAVNGAKELARVAVKIFDLNLFLKEGKRREKNVEFHGGAQCCPEMLKHCNNH